MTMVRPGLIALTAAPDALPPGSPRPWWEGRPFVAALILAAFLPLLWPGVPPLVDLPGHMGRFAVAAGQPDAGLLARYYEFRWLLIGNLGVDLLVVPLAGLVGIEWATRLVVMAIPALTIAGFLWVSREVHHRLPPTAGFVFPFAFSYPLLFGFVNFALAMGLAFVAFGLWLRLSRLGRIALRGWLFVPISFLLFVCHTFGWGTLGLLAFSAEAVRVHDQGRRWWRAAVRAGFSVLPMAGPLLLVLLWRNGATGGEASDWFNWPVKVEYLLSVLRDRWLWVDALKTIAIFAVLLMAVVERQLTLSRNLIFTAFVLGLTFLLLPRVIFGSAYADMRLAPYVVATAVLAIRFRGDTDARLGARLATGAALFVALSVATTSASLAVSWREWADRLPALERVKPGSAVLTLVDFGCEEPWALRRHSHIGSFAIVRRAAFANDQWPLTGSSLLSITYRQAGRFAFDPSQKVQSAHCRPRSALSVEQAASVVPAGAFDYLWLVDDPRGAPPLAGWRILWSGPGSALYAPAVQAGRRSTQP